MTAPPPPVLIHRVIARLNVGGPAMHVVNLTRALDDRGGGGPFRTRLVAGSVPRGEGDMTYYARERGVEVTLIAEMSRDVSPLDDLRSLLALYRLFRRERPGVVHTHTAKAGTLGRLAAALAGVPVRVHTYHGHVLGGGYFTPARTRFFLQIERWLARLTSLLVVLTEAQAREMADGLGVAPRERFQVVPLGLELDAFAAVDRERARAEVQAELGLTPEMPVLGIVGRLVPIKNHELLLRGTALLRRRKPDLEPRLLVIGSGQQGREAELRALAADLGLGEVVHWLGWRRDLPRLYAALDVLALTSRDEGTPVAVLEALAAGTPVVATAVGGVPEVLEGGRLGSLVPPGDENALAGALEAALASGEVATPEARRRVADRYSVARLASDLAELYRRELSRVG